MTSSPMGIVLLAIIQLLTGLWDLLLSLALLDVAKGNATEGLVNILGIAYLILGLSSLWLARGYAKGYEWARRRGSVPGFIGSCVRGSRRHPSPSEACAGFAFVDNSVQPGHPAVSGQTEGSGLLRLALKRIDQLWISHSLSEMILMCDCQTCDLYACLSRKEEPIPPLSFLFPH